MAVAAADSRMALCPKGNGNQSIRTRTKEACSTYINPSWAKIPLPVSSSVARPMTKPSIARRPFQVSEKIEKPNLLSWFSIVVVLLKRWSWMPKLQWSFVNKIVTKSNGSVLWCASHFSTGELDIDWFLRKITTFFTHGLSGNGEDLSLDFAEKLST